MSIAAINTATSIVTNIVWDDMNKDVEAVTKNTVINSLTSDVAGIPFRNKRVLFQLQQADPDLKLVAQLKVTGDLPSKENANKIINKILRECCLNKDGLVIAKTFDHRTMREMEKIVIPQTYLHSVLSLLHSKLLHPSVNQLNTVFDKYSAKIIKLIKENCDICVGLTTLPKEFQLLEANNSPSHPGSHFNIDILRRSSQKIMVCTGMFSGFTTASFISSESKESIEPSFILLKTPIIHSPSVQIRTDKAPAFKSIAANPSQ